MKILIASVLFLGLGFSALAEEKDGVRVDVTKKTLERNDGRAGYARDIGRIMALHAVVKNVSFNDWPEGGTVEWFVVVQRWNLGETENLEAFQGTEKLPALKKAGSAEMDLGEITIGGHMHGTSKMHVDEIGGWKVVVKHEGKTTEFTSSSSFERMYKRAGPKTEKKAKK